MFLGAPGKKTLRNLGRYPNSRPHLPQFTGEIVLGMPRFSVYQVKNKPKSYQMSSISPCTR